MSRAQAPGARRGTEFWVVTSVLTAALTITAAIGAWPIYASFPFILLVIVASAAGAGIALLAIRRRLSALVVSAAALGAYVVLVIPLAIPDSLASLDTVPGGLVSAVTAPVTAWKELVTIGIPVGSYRATLVPALIVFLLGPLLALLAAWRLDARAVLAAPVLLLMQLFGLAFGASSVSAPLFVGPLAIPAPREIALSLVALALVIALLVWRSAWDRRQAIYRARDSSGVRSASSHRPAAVRRAVVAVGMLALAGLIAGVALAPVVAPSGREVLRTEIEPALQLRDAVSPLSTYRLAFGDDLYDEVLFTVQTQGPTPDRLRLATLAYYDGAAYRVAEFVPGAATAADFRRVPTVLPGRPDGERAQIEIEIGSLSGVWLPLPQSTSRVEFAGPRRSSLIDGFYYSDALDAGIQLADGGLTSGDQIVIEALASDVSTISELPSVPVDQRQADATVPEELVEWVQEQDLGVDGASLQELIDRLRARGYLSHSLEAPAGESDWTTDLAGYEFAPSRSGHDRDRIATLFATLIEREREVGVEGETAPELLVSAVGDDEQFATATALLARYFGYESRVTLGFRLTSDSTVQAPAPCDAGVCRGANLTAWAEVRQSGGDWIAVDSSPQFSNALAPVISTVRDPELPTEVPSQVAENRQSPESPPADGDGVDDSDIDDALDLAWLWAILRVVGLVLLITALVLSPFLTITGAKLARRRRRRRAPDPESRIAGGWLEWMDAALDHGEQLPSNVTRLESARAVVARRPLDADGTLYAAPAPLDLAEWADRAVFSAVPPTDEESEAFWAIVDDERRRWSAQQTFWQRIRSTLSISSFTRAVDARLLVPPSARQVFQRWSPARGATSTRFPKGVTRARRTGRS